jgi:ATP-dependent DNA ligase
MLSKSADAIPVGDTWLYEPKWDGFRALIFKDGENIVVQSRDLKPLNRYFPELESVLRKQLPERCVLDGEIVIAKNGVLDFDALLLRIHPAAARVALLAAEAPCSFVAWDLLALGEHDLRSQPQVARREALCDALRHVEPPLHLTPATTDPNVAADWFLRFEGAGLDGVMAKPLDLAYLPGKRAMTKVKHARTADCVVAGFRWFKDAKDAARERKNPTRERRAPLKVTEMMSNVDKRVLKHIVGVIGIFAHANSKAMDRRRHLREYGFQRLAVVLAGAREQVIDVVRRRSLHPRNLCRYAFGVTGKLGNIFAGLNRFARL